MNRLGYMIIHFGLHPLLLGLLGRQDVFEKRQGILKRQILAIISNNIEHCYLRIVNF